jgi:hypothetical protein
MTTEARIDTNQRRDKKTVKPAHKKTTNKKPLSKQDVMIAAQRAAGASLQEIANTNGFHEATACRRLQQPEIKALVEQINHKLITEATGQAAQNIIDIIHSYNSDDITIKTLSLKYSDKQMQAIGIYPSHTPSVLIQQIYNQSDPHVGQELGQLREFLQSRISGANQGVVIDVPVNNSTCQPMPELLITTSPNDNNVLGNDS